jgi:hypothetical protein
MLTNSVDDFAKKKRKVRDTLCAPKTKTKKKVRRQLVTLAKKNLYIPDGNGRTYQKERHIRIRN